MDKEKQVKIMMCDRCTKAEAEKFLESGSVVFEDLQVNFEKYMNEWKLDPEEIENYKNMIDTKKPIPGWGVVTVYNETYFIMYID